MKLYLCIFLNFFISTSLVTWCHAETLSADMNRLCGQAQSRQVTTAKRLPEDRLLASISQTQDLRVISAALGQDHPDKPRDKYGTTALIGAVIVGNWRAAAFFLQKGADINLANTSGSTPLDVAVFQLHADIACQLIKRGAHIPAADSTKAAHLLPAAAMNPKFDDGVLMVKFFLNKGYAVNSTYGAFNDTALHTATEVGNLPLVRLLIERGADLDLKNNASEDALHIAKRCKHIQIEKVLAKAMADRRIKKTL
jgi:ankyrin repeat protein